MDQKVIKTLLILKHSVDSLTTIETFLMNRDWVVFSCLGVRESLELIVNNKPQFVMIPTDHPDPQVRNLPKILIKTLPVCILYYIEVLNVKNVKQLQEVESEYILSPPVTGPGIERMASKFFKRFQIEMRDFEKRKAMFDYERRKAEPKLVRINSSPNLDLNLELTEVSSTTSPQDLHIGPGGEKTTDHGVRLVREGAQAALELVLRPSGLSPIEVIQETSEVACISLDSPHISGYLLAALGQNRKLDERLMQTLKASLSQFLIKQGEEPLDHENLQLNIAKVAFEPWANEYGKFLIKTDHEGLEMAMSFFSREQVKLNMAIAGLDDMVAIKMQELSEGAPLDFNAYIYLPNNQKYILYTPKGGKIYQSQKDRLEKVGVGQMYVFKAESYDIDVYRARNYLNNLVDSFNRKSNKEAIDESVSEKKVG